MQTDTIISPPRTIMEVYNMLPEGTLAEVIDSKLYMSPAPKTTHQRVIRKLSTQISNFIESRGEVFFSPCDVYLEEVSNVVQPDIIYLEESQTRFIEEDGIHGVPALLIEVLSPGNPKHDSETKKELYERFGVKEYWIIDPQTRKAIGYTLEDGKFKSLPELTGKIKSIILNQEFEF